MRKTGPTILIGNRLPRDYFITGGKGESDITIHAGSYHLALKDAGIEMCNIMTYSSVLPASAGEIKKPEKLTHGSVMETIMAVAHAEKGKQATAGIIQGWLYHKKTGKKYGGLVCEYNGPLPEKRAKEQLRKSLEELYTNGFSQEYRLQGIKSLTKSFTPRKRFGTALVALCFVNYVYPVQNSGSNYKAKSGGGDSYGHTVPR